MSTYRIESKAGDFFGEYAGRTPREALARMFEDGGVDCTYIKGGDLLFECILFHDWSQRDICGDVDDWVVEKIA